MNSQWKYFFPAVFFGSYLLVSNGVPLVPVFLGCCGAAALIWFKSRKATR